MIGFPASDFSQYDFIRKSAKDQETLDSFEFPVEYMFKDVPKALAYDDPVAATLSQMDMFGIARGVIGVHDEVSQKALRRYPDRFVGQADIDPNRGMAGIRELQRLCEEHDVRSVSCFPAGLSPQVPIDDKKMYPVYAKCVELDIPIFVCAGVPGPRLPMACQRVELIDEVMYDFPELVLVTRHGCEPWDALAVKLMLKWPGLHYSTSAFSPKYYPKAIVDYANTRGADKVLYGGYFPMGLSLERIMRELPRVPFRDEVWPKFLHQNAARILKL
jgi:hypothetical protein